MAYEVTTALNKISAMDGKIRGVQGGQGAGKSIGGVGQTGSAFRRHRA